MSDTEKTGRPIWLQLISTVPKLNGSNYREWKFAVSIVLKQASAYDAVTSTEEKGATTRAASTESAHGLTIISLTIDPSQYIYIESATNGREAWKALADLYEKPSRANHIHLKRSFYGYMHSPTKNIQEYISGITSLAAQLRNIGVTLEDDDIIDVLLFNLDNSWSSVTSSLVTMENLKLATLISTLQDEGKRREHKEDPESETGYFVNTRGKRTLPTTSIVCGNCGKPGHSHAQCYAPGGGSEGLGPKSATCFVCGKDGHKAKDCQFMKKAQEIAKKEDGKESAQSAMEPQFAF